MGTQIDYQIGLGLESTYGTSVTPTRFFESEVAFDYTPVKVQGSGTRPGKSVNRLDRNVLARVEASGTMDVEVGSSGFGVLLEAVMGKVQSAEVTGDDVQQHTFTLADTDYLKSYTIQGVVPTLGGSSPSLVQTFVGCMASAIEFTASEGEILKAKIDWTAQDMSLLPAAAVAAYPTSSLFTFVHGAIAANLAPDTMGAPTATQLATPAAGTDVAPNVRSASVKIDNALDGGGYNLGGAGKRSRKQALGKRAITGKITAELTDVTLRNAYVTQKPVALILTFKISPTDPASPTLQIVLPSVLLKGGTPKSAGGDVPTVDADFEAFDNGAAAQPIWIIYRTQDLTP